LTPRLLAVLASRLLQGYIVGCGLSGCATSLLSFLSQLRAAGSGAAAHTPEDVAPAAFLYFACSAGITGLCTLSFSLLTRLKYSRMKLEPYLASECQARERCWAVLFPPPIPAEASRTMVAADASSCCTCVLTACLQAALPLPPPPRRRRAT
jgi:hypothetical protein